MEIRFTCRIEGGRRHVFRFRRGRFLRRKAKIWIVRSTTIQLKLDQAVCKQTTEHRSVAILAPFREITTWGLDDVMWSNLAKCDYEGGTVFQLDEDLRKAFFNAQAGLLHSELSIAAS